MPYRRFVNPATLLMAPSKELRWTSKDLQFVAACVTIVASVTQRTRSEGMTVPYFPEAFTTTRRVHSQANDHVLEEG